MPCGIVAQWPLPPPPRWLRLQPAALQRLVVLVERKEAVVVTMTVWVVVLRGHEGEEDGERYAKRAHHQILLAFARKEDKYGALQERPL